MLQQIILYLSRQDSISQSKMYYKDMLIYGVINRQVVGATGFEPATARPPGVCATRLRYAPIPHI